MTTANPKHRESSTPDVADVEASSDARVVFRLLKLAWRYRWGCIKVLGVQLVLLLMGLSGLGLAGLGIDVLRHALQAGAPAPHWPWGLEPRGWSTHGQLTVVAIGVLVLALLRGVLSGWYNLSMGVLLQGRIVPDLRADVYNKLQRLGLRYFQGNTTGSLINRVTGDVQNVRLFIDGVVMQLIILTITLAVYLVYMLSLHPGLTGACLATTPLIYLLARRFSRAVQPAYRRERELFDDLVLNIAENVQGMHVIKGFARQAHEQAAFAQRQKQLTAQKQWIFWRVTTYPMVMGVLALANLVILLVYGGYLVIEGRFALGMGMIVFAGLLNQFSSQVQSLATVTNSLQQSLISAKRVFEVLDVPVEVVSPPDGLRIGRARGKIEFRNVTFHYTNDQPVLSDVSFTVLPGQEVAILGATGS